ncbi:MAG: hypothetical protein IPP40_01940 [bacterium]|nr:hypothetical protein [bacterium]
MILPVRHDGPLPGQFLMDRDLAELEAASRREFGPLLSLYQWKVPTLSLGYHQDTDKIDLVKLNENHVPLVRRPTGGAAVLHSEELTYSIVIPDADDLRSGALLLEFVGRALTEGLRAVGVDAELEARGESLSPLPNRTSCFVRTSRWEVTAKGKKIVGSAQRRLGGALLQHGSILVGEDHLRIVDFLSVSREEDRALLRQRLSEKATCVENEIGSGDHMPQLRTAFEQSFQRAYFVFSEQLHDLGKPVAL